MAITRTGVRLTPTGGGNVIEEYDTGAVSQIYVSGLQAATEYTVEAYVVNDGQTIWANSPSTFTTKGWCNVTWTSNNNFYRDERKFSISFRVQCYPYLTTMKYWWSTDPNFPNGSTGTGNPNYTQYQYTDQTFNFVKNTYLPDAGGTIYEKLQVNLSDGSSFIFTNSKVCPIWDWDVASSYTVSGNDYTFTAVCSNPAEALNTYKIKDNWLKYTPVGGSEIETSKVSGLGTVTVTLNPADYRVSHHTEDYWNEMNFYAYPTTIAAMNPYIADIVSSGSTATFDLQFYQNMTITDAVLEWTDGVDTWSQRIAYNDPTTWVLSNLDAGNYRVLLSVTDDNNNTYKSSEQTFKIE